MVWTLLQNKFRFSAGRPLGSLSGFGYSYSCGPNTGQVSVFSLDKYAAFRVQYVTEEKRFVLAVITRVNTALSYLPVCSDLVCGSPAAILYTAHLAQLKGL